MSRILAFAICLALGGLIGVGVAGLNMVGALTWADLPYIASAAAGIALLLGFILVISMVGPIRRRASARLGRELARDANEIIREHGNA